MVLRVKEILAHISKNRVFMDTLKMIMFVQYVILIPVFTILIPNGGLFVSNILVLIVLMFFRKLLIRMGKYV